MENIKTNIDQMIEENVINRLVASISSISKEILDDRKKVKITVVKSTWKVEIPVRHTQEDVEYYTFGWFLFLKNPLQYENNLRGTIE